MTLYFMDKFQAANECRLCPKGTETERRFCAYHLMKARNAFRVHVQRCKIEGRCINCHKAPIKDELRCPEHKEINRLRCFRWMKTHAVEVAQHWQDRRAQSRATGRCVYCGPKRPVIPGTLRCRTCALRSDRLSRTRA